MRHLLLLGQARVGRQTFLQNLTDDLSPSALGPFTSWANDTIQFITVDQSLTATQTKMLPQLDAVIVCVDLPTLIHAEHKLDFINWVMGELDALPQKKIPVVFTVTKSDCLYGFREYFNHYSTEQRESALSLLKLDEAHTLVKQINLSVIQQLHHEPLIEKRSRIQAFPSQFAQAIDVIIDTIHRCISTDQWVFSGLFFISCKQKQAVINALTHQPVADIPTLTEKPFFVQGLYNYLVKLTTHVQTHRQRTDYRRWIIIPLSIVLIIVCLGAWHTIYKRSVQTVARTQHLLTQVSHNPDSPRWLRQLKKLHTAKQSLNNPIFHYARYVGLPQTHQLIHTVTDQYNRLLETHYLPLLEGQIEQYIKHQAIHDLPTLYESLKVYLMLTTQQHVSQTAIEAWFSHHWTDKQAQQLQPYLTALLSHTDLTRPINKSMVEEVRGILAQLPAANLAFLQLQTHYLYHSEAFSKLLPHQSIIDLSQITIPSLYTPANFKHIYNSQIRTIVSQLKWGDWVTDQSAADLLQGQTTAQLVSSLQSLYLRAFSNYWQLKIDALKLNPIPDLNTLAQVAKALTNPHSTIHTFLKFMIGNATLSADITPSSSVRELQDFYQHQQPPTTLNDALSGIAQLAQTIDDNSHPTHASFTVASTLISQSQKENPISALLKTAQNKNTLLHHWSAQIAQDCWQLLLNNTQDFLAEQWKKSITDDYKNDIENKYPIDENSKSDISPSNFTVFFGPDGKLESFFMKWLKPFVNTTSHYWTWKSYLGQTLTLPQSLLDNFIRANLIQEMFFSHERIDPHFAFTLTLTHKSPAIKEVRLFFDGQSRSSQEDHTSLIHWPGNKVTGASWVVTRNDHKKLHVFYDGPWAALRLIQSGTLKRTNDPTQYEITFSHGEDQWTYQLVAKNKINPWLPLVLHEFVLPESLDKATTH